jgi:HD-GYP domain-containing protein (c-di-GMP phosphodiesterase class II)
MGYQKFIYMGSSSLIRIMLFIEATALATIGRTTYRPVDPQVNSFLPKGLQTFHPLQVRLGYPMSDPKLNASIRRSLGLRLGGAALLLCAVFATIAWFNGQARMADAVTELARLEANRLNRSAMPLLDDPQTGAEAWQAALEQLAREGAGDKVAGGRFVLARVFSPDGNALAALEDENFPGINAVREVADADSFKPPTNGDYRVVSRAFGDQSYVGVAIALRDSKNSIRAWLGGAFAVSPAAMQKLRADVLRSVLYVIGGVLLTALAIYPVVSSLVNRVARAGTELLTANLETLQVLGSAIAKRDGDTDAHNYRVAVYAVRLAEAAGLPEQDMPALIKGALLHDVGKLGIRDDVLLKPDKLSESEFEVMKTHVEHGLDITGRARWLHDAMTVVGGHHEKFDGQGYPEGLAGSSSPLSARIFAIADVFDALGSERPYKEPRSLQDALATMSRGRGSHFDPELFDCFTGIAAQLKEQFGSGDGESARQELQRLLAVYFQHDLDTLTGRG